MPEQRNAVHCSICSCLKDQEYAFQKYGSEDDNTYLPKAAAKLETVIDYKPYSSRASMLKRCPECGTHYLYETDYEYLVNGTEDEEFLTRLKEEDLKDYLPS